MALSLGEKSTMNWGKYKQPLLAGGAITAIFIVLSFLLPVSASNILARILIMMLFATGVNIMFGYGGLIAFGQAIFFGSAAYIYTLLVVRAGMNAMLAFPLTLMLCLVLSILIGMLTLRVQALTFGLLFMGLNILFYNLSIKVPQLGSGSGIAGALRPSFASGTTAFYFFTLLVVVVCFVAMYVILHSSFANAARGIRENEERMIYIGVDIKKVKLRLIVLSSFFVSVAGVLYSMLNLGAYTSYLNVNISTQGLVMCLVGGMFSFFGPSLGAILITLVTVAISNLTIYYNAVLGLILILAILFFPSGILGQNADDKGRAKMFFISLFRKSRQEDEKQ